MIVKIMMAVTVDGRIAKDDAHLADWTSKEDKDFFREETLEAGVIVMGINTFKTMGKPLKDRLNVILTTEPEEERKGFENQSNIEFFSGDHKKLLSTLKEKGYDTVVLCGGAFVNSAFIQERLVDEIVLTVEPIIFGKGMNFIENLDLELPLKLLEVKQLNGDSVVLRYKIIWEH